jgi:hypothetical protein
MAKLLEIFKLALVGKSTLMQVGGHEAGPRLP